MHQTFTLVSTLLKNTKNKQHVLPVVKNYEPSEALIHNILNYSKSLSVIKSKSVDFIEVVAN